MSDPLDQTLIEERARMLVNAALRAGANDADAVAARAKSFAVGYREGALEEHEHSENDSLALRVFVDDRKASISTNRFDNDEELVTLAGRAVAMARLSPPDPFARLVPADLLMSGSEIAPRLEALDQVDLNIPDSDLLSSLALEAEEAAMAVDGITKSGGSGAAHSLGGMVLATSNGFVGSYLASRLSFSVTAIAGRGTSMERDYAFSSAVHGDDLKSSCEIGKLAGERAVARLNPRKLDTGNYDVIFDKRIASSLLGHFASAINGWSVARHTSFLKDKLGKQVFSNNIDIVDDPTRPRGLASCPFDGEGLPCDLLHLVENGRLNQWILDSATAAELGLKTNGRAQRSGANPRPSTTNLTLQAGEQSLEEMIASIRNGVYLTDLIGQGVNGVTGDYSRGASGFRIENGELTEAISEITIADNLIDMFARLIPANDLCFEYAVNAPSVLIEAMTVAGR